MPVSTFAMFSFFVLFGFVDPVIVRSLPIKQPQYRFQNLADFAIFSANFSTFFMNSKTQHLISITIFFKRALA